VNTDILNRTPKSLTIPLHYDFGPEPPFPPLPPSDPIELPATHLKKAMAKASRLVAAFFLIASRDQPAAGDRAAFIVFTGRTFLKPV
jgi:hypothetical protein